MSELVVKQLKSRGVSDLRIANRTPERAHRLAERVEGVAVGFEELPAELALADVVVSSTGSGEWVIGREMVARALEGRTDPIFFVDIAVPRDVDPTVQALERTFVYDIDDLQAVVERNADGRREAAEDGEAMIGPAVEEFMGWISSLHAVPLIKELRDGAERIRRHELSRALRRMELSPGETETVERMSHSLVNKLLHGPISEIKALAEAGHPLGSVEVRRRLLALEGLEVELHRSGPKTTP